MTVRASTATLRISVLIMCTQWLRPAHLSEAEITFVAASACTSAGRACPASTQRGERPMIRASTEISFWAPEGGALANVEIPRFKRRISRRPPPPRRAHSRTAAHVSANEGRERNRRRIESGYGVPYRSTSIFVANDNTNPGSRQSRATTARVSGRAHWVTTTAINVRCAAGCGRNDIRVRGPESSGRLGSEPELQPVQARVHPVAGQQ